MRHENRESKERLLRLPEVKQRTGLSRSSIYAYISMGDFPKGIKLGARCVAWAEGEIDRWLAARIQARDTQGGAS